MLLLGLILVIHEFGHYLLAKLFGVHVPSFGVGIGPRFLTLERRIWGTRWRLAPLFCMGYAALHVSEDDGFSEFLERPLPRFLCRLFTPVLLFYRFLLPSISDGDEDDTGKIGVNDIRPWQRLLIAFAGPGINYLSAGVLLFVLFLCYGDNTFAVVTHGKLANLSGMESYYMKGGNCIVDAAYNACVTVLLFIYVGVQIAFLMLRMLCSGHMPLHGAVESVEDASHAIQAANTATGGLILPEICGIFVLISIMVATLNLIPLPGLDGMSFVVEPASFILPKRLNRDFAHAFRLAGIIFVGSLMAFMIFRDLFVYLLRVYQHVLT